jgi:hypothetical protein
MTIPSAMEKLLDEILGLQDEDGRGAALTEERVRDVLLGRDAFTAQEERLLMTSPLARLTYAEAAEDLKIERAAFRQRCEAANVVTTTAQTLLAAESSDESFTRQSRDFIVSVRPHPIAAGGWVITLTLGERFQHIVCEKDVLALVDDRDETWLRGEVNCYGEIHCYDWPYAGTPADRMRRNDLALHVRYG